MNIQIKLGPRIRSGKFILLRSPGKQILSFRELDNLLFVQCYSMWITAFLLTVFSTNLLLGDVTYNTIPDTNNGRAYIFAEEGTINVSVYCKVFIDGEQFQSRWLVKRQSDTVPIEPEFNVSGQVTGPLPLASTLIGKIIATGELIPNTSVASHTNFTIVNLTSEFHLSQVQCGPQGDTLREFNFGFPGMIIA